MGSGQAGALALALLVAWSAVGCGGAGRGAHVMGPGREVEALRGRMVRVTPWLEPASATPVPLGAPARAETLGRVGAGAEAGWPGPPGTASTLAARATGAEAGSDGGRTAGFELGTRAAPGALGTPDAPGAAAVPDALAVRAVQAAAGGNAALPRVTHVWQKWNNCGPSAALMALSAFGVHRDQQQLAARLKPHREDTNVTPDEIAALVDAEGLSALVRYHGNRDVVRTLVSLGVPVIAEQWIHVDGRGEMGHYRVVIGFDDLAETFQVHDSYYGPNRSHSFADFEHMWRPFVGAYVAVFDAAREPAVRLALGPDYDKAAMWARARVDHEVWAAAEPQNAWAHFALGEVRSRLGHHDAAVAAFERAVAIGLPYRAFWYQFGYYRSLYALGAYDRLVAHADATLTTMGGTNLEESRYWRGMALAALGREAEALQEFETALVYNSLYEAARLARDGIAAGTGARP